MICARLGSRCCTLLVILALAACGGGSHSSPLPDAQGAVQPPAPPPSSGSTSIAYGQRNLAGATYLGAAHLTTVGIDVHVALRDAAGLMQYAREASDPSSAFYRQWLTPQQLGDRFGALQSDYDASAAALVAAGIAVEKYPQRQMLRLRGPQAAVERLLGTTFGVYRAGTRTFVAVATAPHPTLRARVVALGGAVALSALHRNFVPVRPGNALGYAPQQIANAFDYTGAYHAGYTGSGITIGIIGTGIITDGYAGFGSGGDVAEYKHLYGIGGSGTVTQVYSTDANVSPGNPSVPGGQYSKGLLPPPPPTAPSSPGCAAQHIDPNNPDYNSISDFTTCNPEDFEAQLDTEQAAALAPDANVRFYLAYNPNECGAPACGPTNPGSAQEGLNLFDDEVQEAIADDRADVMSLSFTLPESGTGGALGFYFDGAGNGFGPTEFASLASEGVAVFVASGDSGAQGCSSATAVVNSLCVSYPATDPSATSIGGTNTPLDQSGRLVGPLTGWGFQTEQGAGGSGGGCSTTFPLPAYEAGIAGQKCGTRSQPDVSLDGDARTGVSLVVNAPPSLGGRSIGAVGGTSVATPEFAAMWSLVLQACKQNAGACGSGSGATPYRLGNPSSLLYKIYTSGNKGLTYGQVFYDVLYGNNALTVGGATPAPGKPPALNPGFMSTAGYDLVTGLGAPYGRNLVRAVAGV